MAAGASTGGDSKRFDSVTPVTDKGADNPRPG
jgi:hypothetical protein